MQAYPLLFQPTFKSRIWGGSRLREWFPNCPTDTVEPIGEAWVLSDHPAGESLIANGNYAGQPLYTVVAEQPSWFPGIASGERFPLLIKWIDAADDLSVQVHPDDSYGRRHAGEQGKTECWWILDTVPGAKIVYGHTASSRQEFEERVRRDEWSHLLIDVEPHKGDFFFVPSGKLHALGKGTMVLEIQQSSDTTYRVFDYHRVGADGRERELHLEDAFAVVQYPDEAVPSQRRPMDGSITGEHLVTCPYFTVDKWDVHGSLSLTRPAMTILCVIEGDASLTASDTQLILRPGVQVLLPYGMDEVTIRGSVSILAVTLP